MFNTGMNQFNKEECFASLHTHTDVLSIVMRRPFGSVPTAQKPNQNPSSLEQDKIYLPRGIRVLNWKLYS
jgi:hypothetical protein